MDELDSLPSSLDSFLNDAFADSGTWPLDSEQSDPKSESVCAEPASFNPDIDWKEWDLDDDLHTLLTPFTA